MTLLVTGATGNVGRNVVDQLLAAGHRVRGLSRTPERASLPPEVEVVKGDLSQPDTLKDAFTDVTGVFLISMDGTSLLKNGQDIMSLAREAGVQRVVVMSGDYEDGAFERAVEESGLAWTHLRPMEFMVNATDWSDSIKEESVVRSPFGDWTSAMIHEADIAAVAVTALTEDGHAGKIYTLTGPEALKRRDIVGVIGDAIGREVRFQELTPDEAREYWRTSVGYPDEVIEWFLEMGADQPEPVRTVLPTVEQVTGRPARTFAQWAAEHADDFR
ncbi:NAD(P)H-binding protein [Streptomyces cyaneofuscatus]|uniref:NAD(P)H-binding protein n=1 Tax=Streptomyces cyaneofuscatus TaxID=66883 RepID=UPI0033A6F6D1